MPNVMNRHDEPFPSTKNFFSSKGELTACSFFPRMKKTPSLEPSRCEPLDVTDCILSASLKIGYALAE
jgi:hypothetical protein